MSIRAKSFLRGSAPILFCGLLLSGTHGANAAENDNPLFNITNDPKTIRRQIELALPALERGIQLLQSAPDPSEASKAQSAFFECYAYLRAAQESGAQLMNTSKFPDPMIRLRNERIWGVRQHMIKCRAAFTPDDQGVNMCMQEATAGLRELRFILQVFP